MTEPPRTTTKDLDIAYQVGKEAGLHFIYPGNLPGHVGDRENTFCPNCDATLIRRQGFYVVENRMVAGNCPDCGNPIPGVWEEKAPRSSNGNGYPRALRV
jgi:pyruvate formate lyase activating enzyme